MYPYPHPKLSPTQILTLDLTLTLTLIPPETDDQTLTPPPCTHMKAHRQPPSRGRTPSP